MRTCVDTGRVSGSSCPTGVKRSVLFSFSRLRMCYCIWLYRETSLLWFLIWCDMVIAMSASNSWVPFENVKMLLITLPLQLIVTVVLWWHQLEQGNNSLSITVSVLQHLPHRQPLPPPIASFVGIYHVTIWVFFSPKKSDTGSQEWIGMKTQRTLKAEDHSECCTLLFKEHHKPLLCHNMAKLTDISMPAITQASSVYSSKLYCWQTRVQLVIWWDRPLKC